MQSENNNQLIWGDIQNINMKPKLNLSSSIYQSSKQHRTDIIKKAPSHDPSKGSKNGSIVTQQHHRTVEYHNSSPAVSEASEYKNSSSRIIVETAVDPSECKVSKLSKLMTQPNIIGSQPFIPFLKSSSGNQESYSKCSPSLKMTQ